MLLLHEMGLGRATPPVVIEAFVRAFSTHYLPTFPFRAEEVPPGIDPIRQVPCHCQLGCVYQVLAGYGLDVDARLPWIRPWFLRYQLPDGGLNCDEAAYTRPVPRSSMVSTLPALEAVLHCTDRPFTQEEEAFLDRGARYLIERRLWRSLSRGGAVMDGSWALPCFPRLYHYDLLRGLAFLARWAAVRGAGLPRAAVSEALEVIARQAGGHGDLAPGRRATDGVKTLRRGPDGAWRRGEPASTFPLLDLVSRVGVASPYLGRPWAEVRASIPG
ncbi:MAG: hypothetical protein HY722_06495 [Planctomycetes bacterium]|nr:hypothetical protein [Planctomycetota bacterium]